MVLVICVVFDLFILCTYKKLVAYRESCQLFEDFYFVERIKSCFCRSLWVRVLLHFLPKNWKKERFWWISQSLNNEYFQNGSICRIRLFFFLISSTYDQICWLWIITFRKSNKAFYRSSWAFHYLKRSEVILLKLFFRFLAKNAKVCALKMIYIGEVIFSRQNKKNLK